MKCPLASLLAICSADLVYNACCKLRVQTWKKRKLWYSFNIHQTHINRNWKVWEPGGSFDNICFVKSQPLCTMQSFFLHSGRRPTGAKRPSAGCPECICNRPRPWRRPCVSDWGCGAVILLSRGEFGREKNKICYQRGCIWTFCYMPNL